MLYGKDDIQAFEEAQPLNEDSTVFYDSDGEYVFEVPSTIKLTDDQTEWVRQLVTTIANKYHDDGIQCGKHKQQRAILNVLGL